MVIFEKEKGTKSVLILMLHFCCYIKSIRRIICFDLCRSLTFILYVCETSFGHKNN